MKIGSSAELFDGKADHFNREQRMLQPNCGQNLYLRSLANGAGRGAGAGGGRGPAGPGRGAWARGVARGGGRGGGRG